MKTLRITISKTRKGGKTEFKGPFDFKLTSPVINNSYALQKFTSMPLLQALVKMCWGPDVQLTYTVEQLRELRRNAQTLKNFQVKAGQQSDLANHQEGVRQAGTYLLDNLPRIQ